MDLDEARQVATFDPACAIREVLAGAARANPAGQSRAMAFLAEQLPLCKEIWPTVADACGKHLEAFGDRLFAQSVAVVRADLESKRRGFQEASAAHGRVNALFVSATGRGAVHPLVIRSAAWQQASVGMHFRLKDIQTNDVFRAAISQGALAAEAWLLSRRRNPSPDDFLLLRAHWREAALPTLPDTARLDGESIGLASAVANVASLLRVTVPPDCAFTGTIDKDGNVGAVNDVPAKVEAAHRIGISRVFVPSGSPAPCCNGLSVVPVGQLEQVIANVLPKELASALEGLFGIQRPPHYADVRLDEFIKPDRRVVLFSAVGTSDPLGFIKDEHGRAIRDTSDEGPILSICRVVRPSAVWLVFTTSSTSPKSHMQPAAEQTKQSLVAQGLVEEANVKLNPMPDVNPTDFATVCAGFDQALTKAMNEGALAKDDIVTLNGTSGTPTMIACWVLLRMKLQKLGCSNVAVLQSVEAEFAKGHPFVVRNASIGIDSAMKRVTL